MLASTNPGETKFVKLDGAKKTSIKKREGSGGKAPKGRKREREKDVCEGGMG